MADTSPFRVRHLGLCDYSTTLEAMRNFTLHRTLQTPDEIWLLEHPPTYTLGQNGNPADILHKTSIPIIQTDRGGQVTYHGPGQLIIYPLLRLARLKCNIRALVSALEDTIIQLLERYGIEAYAQREAPGVYIESAKIASVGLRIKNGCAYHGLALNVNMDLTPFQHINPCGFTDLKVTQLIDQGGSGDIALVGQQFLEIWQQQPFYHHDHSPN